MPFPGVSQIGRHGAALGLWDFVLLQEQTAIPEADCYILGAYDPSYEQLISSLSLTSKVGVCWTSSVGEVDLMPVEHRYLWTILNQPAVQFIWFGDRSLAKVYPEKSFYSPYPFFWSGNKVEVKKQPYCTLFCPSKMSKNALVMLLAMRLVQQEADIALHTNIVGYEWYLAKVKHKHYNWLPEDQYYAVLAGARLNLAVSHAETFSYNVAEAGFLGTPSVISETVPLPGIKVRNPNSPLEVAEVILKYFNYTACPITDQLQKQTESNNLMLVEALKNL